MEPTDCSEVVRLDVRRTTRRGNACATMLQNPWAEAILRDFRWHEYMRAYPDLRFENDQQARWHLVYNGYREGRLFDPDRCRRMDPGYYRRRYPELGLETDAQAQFHYCYAGYYENRFANADTEWLYNADLHIYQHGRVGSHSIATALEGCYPGSVVHLHWLSDMALQYPSCSLSYAHILGRSRQTPVRVISAGREVVSRVISGAFQFLETLQTAGGAPDVERIVAHLEGTFLHDCDVVTGWFDHQFHCGLDIYAHDFDHENGYVRLRNGAVDLFLYRQEDIGKLEGPLAEFLGLPDFKLSWSNASDTKGYREAYKHLMRNFVLSRTVLEELYETKYMRFFFSADERLRLMEHWSKPRGT
ncbi:MAG: putative capsular polysaccharide synthesis family protein [Rhodanobacter lindaniclasticus]